MPPLPVVANVIEVQMRATLGADLDVLSRIYWQYSGTAPTDAQLNTMATAVATAWSSDLAALCYTDIALTEVVCTDLTSATAARGIWSGSHAGTSSGTMLPAGVAFNIGFSIARRYRGGKPKVFMPFGVAGDLQTAQTWTSAFATAVATAWGNFTTAVGSAIAWGATSEGQVSVSYFSGFTSVQNPITKRYRNVPTVRSSVTPDAVIGAVYQTRVASQRRRNGKAA